MWGDVSGGPSSGREEGPGTPGDAASLPGTSPSGCRCTQVGREDMNATAVRGRPLFPNPRPTSPAALATPPLVSKQSGLFVQVPWCPFRTTMPPGKKEERQAGLTQPGGPGRQARPRPVGHGLSCPHRHRLPSVHPTPTSQEEMNPTRGQPRGRPGKSWVEGQVREDRKAVHDSQI